MEINSWNTVAAALGTKRNQLIQLWYSTILFPGALLKIMASLPRD
jgi:hypothetical protein